MTKAERTGGDFKMAYLSLHMDSEYLGAHTNIIVILPDRPQGQTIQQFYSGRKYKVLWLLHGGHGDATEWLRKTKIELYASEHDLMVVCPSAQSSFYQNWPGFGPGYFMQDFFFRELMPAVRAWLPASDRKEDNFIAGLSMGGVGTLTFLSLHPELFSAAAIMSGTPFDLRRTEGGTPNMVAVYRNLAANFGGREKMFEAGANLWEEFIKNDPDCMPRLYFSCGKNDIGYQNYLEYIALLKSRGFRFEHDESSDYGHEWQEWDYQIEKAIRFFLS